MCFVPRRRAVSQEEVEKQLFAFAITSKPHETPMQHPNEGLLLRRSDEAVRPGLSSPVPVSVSAAAPAAICKKKTQQPSTSACCSRVMNGSFRVKMAAV